MLHTSRIALGLALFALLASPGLAPASTQSARKPASKKASKQPEPPPRPPLPEELPPAPPTVIYRGGMLSIAAQNSTLYDILSAVRKATGAAVDTPASATERVATRLGPGRPRDVLAALLDGSHFDYILLSSPQDPGGLRRVILAPRFGGGAGAAPDEPGASPPGESFSQPARPVPARTLPPDSGEEEESVEPAEDVQPEPEPTPPQPPEVKTPEQIQQELQQHEEEQRQQQQQPQQQEQQGPPTPPPQ